MIISLGLFQLESLMLANAPYYLVDLRMQPMVVPSARVQACLNTAKVVEASQLAEHLKTYDLGFNYPVILVCEDGRLSSSEAQKMIDLGFMQVYIVEGGTDGLLREADDFSSSGSII